jgi:hypothetical protein
MRVVADTSVFIVLDRIGHLDVLPRLFGSVVRPRSVLDELLAGDAGHPPSAAVCGQGSGSARSWARSYPAEKHGPAPRMTTTRTSGSAGPLLTGFKLRRPELSFQVSHSK